MREAYGRYLQFALFGYSAILQVQKMFKKKKGYSVFIPASRQQKGVDFLILNSESNAVLKIQVKGSRAYESSDAEQIAEERVRIHTLVQ